MLLSCGNNASQHSQLNIIGKVSLCTPRHITEKCIQTVWTATAHASASTPEMHAISWGIATV